MRLGPATRGVIVALASSPGNCDPRTVPTPTNGPHSYSIADLKSQPENSAGVWQESVTRPILMLYQTLGYVRTSTRHRISAPFFFSLSFSSSEKIFVSPFSFSVRDT